MNGSLEDEVRNMRGLPEWYAKMVCRVLSRGRTSLHARNYQLVALARNSRINPGIQENRIHPSSDRRST
jgi:hypothetical protein